jgi:hypothetical protein
LQLCCNTLSDLSAHTQPAIPPSRMMLQQSRCNIMILLFIPPSPVCCNNYETRFSAQRRQLQLAVCCLCTIYTFSFFLLQQQAPARKGRNSHIILYNNIRLFFLLQQLPSAFPCARCNRHAVSKLASDDASALSTGATLILFLLQQQLEAPPQARACCNSHIIYSFFSVPAFPCPLQPSRGHKLAPVLSGASALSCCNLPYDVYVCTYFIYHFHCNNKCLPRPTGARPVATAI